MRKVSMSYLFSFSRYQIKYIIQFLFRQLMMSQTLRFILDGQQGEKDRRTEIQKFEYLGEEIKMEGRNTKI